ncbi:hypothetical protein [Actinomadura sp. 6K520]|jgi:hypothetical protein|uniref:hypothetical protein n=1 Tax=Actinomadura sp. 6K520 TaxID=2530364 RepID=UPI001042FE82|nr:hypothetical protein [Actinomadura sp. 6K520]TDE38699.1 hypothetical protein E1289_01675 [Actinomadura sp. 6K520]
MKSYTYTELEQLTGEVLPERAVLSTLLVGGGGENENANFNLNHGGGNGDGGTTAVVPNCQSVINSSQGVAAVLAPVHNSSFTCAGSTVVSGH